MVKMVPVTNVHYDDPGSLIPCKVDMIYSCSFQPHE